MNRFEEQTMTELKNNARKMALCLESARKRGMIVSSRATYISRDRTSRFSFPAKEWDLLEIEFQLEEPHD